jgi:hypothetical protein
LWRDSGAGRTRKIWVVNSLSCDHFMIGGSPVPPYCPMRRLESCSTGCSGLRTDLPLSLTLRGFLPWARLLTSFFTFGHEFSTFWAPLLLVVQRWIQIVRRSVVHRRNRLIQHSLHLKKQVIHNKWFSDKLGRSCGDFCNRTRQIAGHDHHW